MGKSLNDIAAEVHAVDPYVAPYTQYMRDEPYATKVETYYSSLIHGTLQLPEVAAAILRAYKPEADEAVIATHLEARQARAAEMAKQGTPIVYYIGEKALQSPLEATAWGAQLHHLVGVAQQPRVAIRVVPHSLFSIAEDETTLLTREDGSQYGYLESAARGDMYTDDQTTLNWLARMFAALNAGALDEAQSIERIMHHSNGLLS